MLNPNDITFAQGMVHGTGSKDKRLSMFPEYIKKFVIESNKEKAMKKELENKRNQDINTRI